MPSTKRSRARLVAGFPSERASHHPLTLVFYLFARTGRTPPFGCPAHPGTFAMKSGYESASRGRNNLEQVIDGLEHRLDELATAQRQIRLLVLGGSVLLMGLMGLFGLRLYSTLQRQLNATQLQNAFMAKVDEVWPPLSQKFMDSAMKAAPAYGEQAMARFEKVRPQLESMLLKETEQFSEQLQASLLKKSEAGMQRVTDKVTQDLKRQLPKLTEQKLDSIEEKLRNSLLIEGGGIADELEAKVAKERIRIEKLLAKLPVDEVAKQSEEKLQRQFIHHVLMMIDQSVAADDVAAK
jgi:hypothetical protein